MAPDQISSKSARYVRVPLGSRVQHPAACPFTGRKNPRSAVRIERRQMQMILPIPFLGLFRLGKVGRIVLPAAWGIAFGARVLALMALLSLAAGFGSLIWLKDEPYAWQLPFWGIAMMYICFGAEWLWLCRVRIVRIGTSSLELRFASREYAEEFCRLNDLHCHTRRTPKRATPIIVNDVG